MDNTQQQINVKSFLLFTDTIRAAFKRLKSYEQRGQLLTKILNYVERTEQEEFDDSVETCFEFVKISLNISEQKYLKKKQQNEAYRALQKQAQEELRARLENSLETAEKAQKNVNKEVNETKKTEIAQPSETAVKYTKENVKKVLNENGINFKPLSFTNFYNYNEKQGWKYEIITAAGFYIEKHPQCLAPVAPVATSSAPRPSESQPQKIIITDAGKKLKSSLKESNKHNSLFQSFLKTFEIVDVKNNQAEFLFEKRGDAENFKERYTELIRDNYKVNINYFFKINNDIYELK